VLVTALVAFPLAARATDASSRSALADKATIAAQLVEERGSGIAKVVQNLRSHGITAYVVRDGKTNPTGLPKRFAVAIAAGRDVHGTALVGGRRMLVEGRAVANGNGLVLVAPAERVLTGAAGVRLLLALAAGLLAGGLAGALLARRLARAGPETPPPPRPGSPPATARSGSSRSRRPRRRTSPTPSTGWPPRSLPAKGASATSCCPSRTSCVPR